MLSLSFPLTPESSVLLSPMSASTAPTTSTTPTTPATPLCDDDKMHIMCTSISCSLRFLSPSVLCPVFVDDNGGSHGRNRTHGTTNSANRRNREMREKESESGALGPVSVFSCVNLSANPQSQRRSDLIRLDPHPNPNAGWIPYHTIPHHTAQQLNLSSPIHLRPSSRQLSHQL